MCGLCGLFGQADHWSDAAHVASDRTGQAERQHRVAVANRVLAQFGLKLAAWSNRYTLTSRTGRMAVVDTIGALWPEAERLSGRACDPLDPQIVAALESGQENR